MKIICVGLCKTGTKSLSSALRHLGYSVYDYDDQVCELSDLWTKFLNGTVTDEEIRKSLDEVDVLVDGPSVALWEEIYRAIPEAKVILNTRDEDSWWKSFSGMYRQNPIWMLASFAALYLTPTGSRIITIGTKCSNLCYGIDSFLPLSLLSKNPRLYKYKFRQHNSHVIQTMAGKSSGFLIHQPKDGWEPLCKFLDKEVPIGTPYPYLNKGADHLLNEGGPQNKTLQKALREAIVALVFVIGFLVAFVCLLVYWILSVF